jgi:hypothetical protein
VLGRGTDCDREGDRDTEAENERDTNRGCTCGKSLSSIDTCFSLTLQNHEYLASLIRTESLSTTSPLDYLCAHAHEKWPYRFLSRASLFRFVSDLMCTNGSDRRLFHHGQRGGMVVTAKLVVPVQSKFLQQHIMVFTCQNIRLAKKNLETRSNASELAVPHYSMKCGSHATQDRKAKRVRITAHINSASRVPPEFPVAAFYSKLRLPLSLGRLSCRSAARGSSTTLIHDDHDLNS